MTLPATIATPHAELISAPSTFFMKRVFPVLAFGSLLLILAVMLAVAHGRANFPYVALLPPLLMAGIFYVVLRRLVFDLADEVRDEGDALSVRFGSEVERIPLSQIVNVSYAGMTNPRRVTLTLRHPGRFGSEVTFSPQETLRESLAGRNALVSELIARADAARRR
jgi:hypothetical protein